MGIHTRVWMLHTDIIKFSISGTSINDIKTSLKAFQVILSWFCAASFMYSVQPGCQSFDDNSGFTRKSSVQSEEHLPTHLLPCFYRTPSPNSFATSWPASQRQSHLRWWWHMHPLPFCQLEEGSKSTNLILYHHKQITIGASEWQRTGVDSIA